MLSRALEIVQPQQEYLTMPDSAGVTPLALAVSTGAAGVARLLLQRCVCSSMR